MAEASFGRARVRWSDVDPLRLLWRGLVSVRFALGLIGFLALASLAGVLIPQLPVEMRGNPAAEAGWLEFQRGKFGFLTDPMDALGLFQVFRSLWFISGLALLVASVCVCTANRLPPIWRNVFSPQTRVPDEYLQGGASVSVAAPNVDALSREFARRRYRVTTAAEGDATYVFADRYPWAQFATFISHLALILFLAGGFVTVVTAREQQVFIAEGEPALPVFAVDDRDHMQVAVEDAVGRFDASGFPLDFRTSLVVYKDGREVAQGVTTVSDPLHYGGYTFHQSFYFPDGAQLKVRDLTTGRTVYDEVLALTSSAATPQVVVRDAAGNVILDDAIIPTDFIADAAGTTVTIPGTGRQFWIGARPGAENADWQLIVFETTQTEGARELLGTGQTAQLGAVSLTFAGITNVPSLVVKSVPGLDGEGVAELSRGPSGDLLTVGPIEGRALALSPGESAVLGNYEYTFGGRREFSGITVRRDPGSMFIWVATGLFLLGLALTFYTPRRRLWGKIASGQAAFRGLGGRQLAVEREIREVAAKASAVE
jgi:cytochrome c biogenesis protein